MWIDHTPQFSNSHHTNQKKQNHKKRCFYFGVSVWLRWDASYGAKVKSFEANGLIYHHYTKNPTINNSPIFERWHLAVVIMTKHKESVCVSMVHNRNEPSNFLSTLIWQCFSRTHPNPLKAKVTTFAEREPTHVLEFWMLTYSKQVAEEKHIIYICNIIC